MANKCISCNNCGHTGWSKNRGNFLITIILMFFFFIPGVIYEIWRRLGLGVCESCNSDLVKPSNSCVGSKPSDIGSLVLLFALGVIGCVVVVFLYAFADGLINGRHVSVKNPKDLENECMVHGLKHYQDLGQYPTLPNGVETSTKVLNDCKNSKDGEYKAP